MGSSRSKKRFGRKRKIPKITDCSLAVIASCTGLRFQFTISRLRFYFHSKIPRMTSQLCSLFQYCKALIHFHREILRMFAAGAFQGVRSSNCLFHFISLLCCFSSFASDSLSTNFYFRPPRINRIHLKENDKNDSTTIQVTLVSVSGLKTY